MGCSWGKVTLGRTGLQVTPLGVASSYGIGATDVERAFDRGVNYFYWGSLRTPRFGEGLRNIARRGREKIVVVIQSYSRVGWLMGPSLELALKRLRMDYADLLLLGWWDRPVPERIMDAAQSLVDKGRARHIMVSCHHRPTFRIHAADPRMGALMVRYNAGHPGAEQDVFPYLPANKPGVVAYTATRWGTLLREDLIHPERVPRGSDCYRFVLSNPHVDLCLMGPRNGEQLDEALTALDRGPMTPDEIAWMLRVGQKARKSVKGSVFSVGSE
ncbi:MAG: aldo/keto reductase [Myxococcota bacterium]